MSAALQIAIVVASVLVLLGLMAAVRAVARQMDLSAEVQRKLVHIGTGIYAMTLPWLFWDRWPVYLLIAMTLVVMMGLRIPRVASAGLGQALHGVERQSYGDLMLALAVGTVFLLAEGRALHYILPIAILTLADAAAALTGSRYGRGFFKVEDGHKSIEGSVAFFLVSLILSMVCLLLLSDVARGNVILVSVVIAAFGTLVEADSWRGFDNLFLPIGVFLFLEYNLSGDTIDLMITITLFLVAIWAFLSMAARFGSTAHRARVYVIAAFLMVSVGDWQNTVLPLLVFVIHAVGRKRNPSDASFPELDIVAAVALVSVGWLGLGNLLEVNALPFYGLHAMGVCVALVALTLAPSPPIGRWSIGAVVAGLLIALYGALMAQNPAAIHWAGDLYGLALVVSLLALIVPGQWPRAFYKTRALRLALFTAMAPLGAYVWMVARLKGWL